MVSVDSFKLMCAAPEYGKAYYRPFICKGDLSKADIFFVGINPATPIFPEYMEIDKYAELLLNYDEFINYYKASRICQNKDEVSRTRIGMNSFFSWLSKHTDSSILETDAIPYPTAKLRDLKKEPQFVKDKGKEIFYSLVAELMPSLIILHGKKTVEHVHEIFVEKGLIFPNDIDVEQLIEEMEKRAPLVQFKYSNGKTGTIMACRHFMYYGSKGDSFESFRDKVLGILKNGPSNMTEGLRHQEQLDRNNPTSQTLSIQSNNFVKEMIPSGFYYFSDTHIQTAALNAKEAKKLEDNSSKRDFITAGGLETDHHTSYVISSILMSVAYLEAFINEIYAVLEFEETERYAESHIKSLDFVRREEFIRLWNKNPQAKWMSTLEKYQLLLKYITQKMDRGQKLYQKVDTLIKLRNYFTHYVPERIEYPTFMDRKVQIADMGLKLKGKFKPNPCVPDNSPFFPDRCLSSGCAIWSIDSVIEFTDEYATMIKWDSYDSYARKLVSKILS